MTSGALLLRVLREPAGAATLTPAEWEALLGAARTARLLPRIAWLLDRAGVNEALPVRVQTALAADRPIGLQHERIIRWEVNRIRFALRGIDTRVVLLKGAAYLIAGLSAARGRLVSDVDILVPRSDLRAVERALMAAGWDAVKLHPYDQRYYREWSHELPPLRHARRLSVVDVHHNILPISGRLHPEADALLAAARPSGEPGLLVLSPEDMLLHVAVHLFQDGEIGGAIRDLVDADALLREFAECEETFWERLVPRGVEHGLARPLFYLLRHARRLLGTPVPEQVMGAAARVGSPAPPILALMDSLVRRALLPVAGDRGTLAEQAARAALYARSHWLKMPPRQLASHLAQKAGRRWAGGDQ